MHSPSGLATLLSALFFAIPLVAATAADPSSPAVAKPGESVPVLFGTPGRQLRYRHTQDGQHAATVVREWTWTVGPAESGEGGPRQWLHLEGTKEDGHTFRIWFLANAYPPSNRNGAASAIGRYLVQEDHGALLEFRDRFTGQAVLPSLAGWRDLLPRDSEDAHATFTFVPPQPRPHWLGHPYQLLSSDAVAAPEAPKPDRTVSLLPDVLVGLPSNRKQKDPTRRYDGSDYEYVKFTRADYHDLVEAGFNCLRVDPDQLPWLEDLDTFYWGPGPADLPFPECLFRSTYLGPTLFLDEPAVGTRDHVLRPRVARDPEFRRNLTPAVAFEAFRTHFAEVLKEGAPVTFGRSLAQRPGVDLGTLRIAQANLYSWETMVATAGYQLSRDPEVPAALVFEPPGRVGTRRIVPELNISYGCQLAVDRSEHLTDVIYGFLRGAARATGKSWGTSVYGAVEPGDAPGFLTRAYDMGATRFFFWDNYQLACVPYPECLALGRLLKAHAESHPQRDLPRLRQAAEVAILLPPGYNLGHVHLGKGSLWGLGELNLERRNTSGVPYRTVMAAFFAEIERCFRLGLAFDLLWDLPEIAPSGYREVVRVREEGRVEVSGNGVSTLLAQPRSLPRPEGQPPRLVVRLSATNAPAAQSITATATVQETSARVYYTSGADPRGVYHNEVVDWELFGPDDEDYRHLTPANHRPQVRSSAGLHEVTTSFRLDRPGTYRLRAGVCDQAGRTTVTWTVLEISK